MQGIPNNSFKNFNQVFLAYIKILFYICIYLIYKDMGFFSWKTQDTNRSIANAYSNKPTFSVTMIDNTGKKWYESDYEGYGVFGGKDYYQLLAEMNKPDECTGDESNDRIIGIRLVYGISCIRHKVSSKVYKYGYDFSNWDDILPHGLGANDSVASGEWECFNLKENNVIFPNLIEERSSKWIDKEPENCEYQGFFYD